MSQGNGVSAGRRLPRVRPFPFAELPRVLRVQAELSRALWRQLAPILDALDEDGDDEGGAWAALEEALGPLSLRAQDPYLFPDSGAAARVQGGVAVEIELLGPAPRRAVLAVDETILPEGPESLPPLLRRVLAGAPLRVGALLAPREVAGALGQAAEAGAQVLGLDLQLRGEGGAAWARLLCGADLRLGAPPPLPEGALQRLLPRAGRLSSVPALLRIEAGQGQLRADEAAQLAAGDVVLLDRFGPRPVVGGSVQLRLGRGAFPAHLDGGGVTVTGPFQLQSTLAGGAGPPSGRSSTMGKDNADKNDDGADRVLRELPVQLTCEIGRITLSGRELLELRPGAVLPVGRPLSGPVDLCAGDRVLARGELVDVEGEIGVRVTEVLD